MSYTERTTCRACGHKELKTILDLMNQPLANSYHKAGVALEEYPLKLNLCEACFHTQLSVVVDPDEMFRHYLYVSGTTATLRGYFEEFYEYVVSECGIDCGKVLDIACNDGSQLEVFMRSGWETYGIDPAENLYETSSKKGFSRVVCDYFSEESASKLGTGVDAVIAQNVFAHTDNIHAFLRACKSITNPGAKIFIQTSQADMFVNGEFDTIYHEHLSFFCVNSMKVCAEQCGLYLIDVSKADIHGRSYVFVLSQEPVISERVNASLEEEKEEGKMSFKLYEDFAAKADNVVSELAECIKKYKRLGYTAVGYGAAAKAMTLLNYSGIELDFIVDDNPMKHGLLTPGSDIPIRNPEALRGDFKLLLIPLAWNFYDEIIARVAKIRGSGQGVFLRYFPELVIDDNS
jgi:2-polyprenyl-3-methyl-5-hydroxy-6-metoxy-1,4-benzoquinol methylase